MRRKSIQTSFGAGELSPEIALRLDTTQYKDGAKSLRNNRILVGGGAMRRPGTGYLATLQGESRLVEFIVNEEIKYIMAFSEGRVDAFLPDGTTAGSVTGAPWDDDIWRTMQPAQGGNTMFLVHPDMVPQVLLRTGASSWSLSDFEFSTSGGLLKQPHYKFAVGTVTLLPSATSGSIDLTVSAPHWTNDHIGTRVRYVGREIEVTGVTSNLIATGTVIEQLSNTVRLDVSTTDKYQVGYVVEGADTGAKGIVVAKGSGYIDVIINDGLTSFGNTESIVGPDGSEENTDATAIDPAATTEWTEQVFGEVYGYPGAVAFHRNRLIFSGHREVPNAIMASRINDYYDHDLGEGGDADAVMELIGDTASAQIKQMFSAEQLLVLTDKGPYYCPESPANPFRASSIAFYPFGSPWPCSDAPIGAFDGGVIMVSGSLIIKLRPTGDQTRAWTADEVSLLSSHLVNNPTDSCFTTNFAGGPERYGIFVNSDGTLAVMQLVEAQQIRNFVPWDTQGEYLSIAALGGDIFVAVQREIDGHTVHWLEKFDQALTLDAALSFEDPEDPEIETRYGGTEINVVAENWHLGIYPLTDPPDSDVYTVGLYFEREIETLPPAVDLPEGVAPGDRMRLVRASVNVLDSAQFSANGTSLTTYQIGEDMNLSPPLRTGWKEFSLLGWGKDPTVTITQADPLPLTVRAIKLEVAA